MEYLFVVSEPTADGQTVRTLQGRVRIAAFPTRYARFDAAGVAQQYIELASMATSRDFRYRSFWGLRTHALKRIPYFQNSASRIVNREHALASFLHLRIPSRKPASTFPGFSLEPVEASRIVDQNLATGLHIRNPYREKIEQMPGVDWEVGCDLRSTHGTR